MSKFLETTKYLQDLNALWDEHGLHIAKANNNLKSLITTAGRLPSTYLSTIKSITTAQNALAKSTNTLSSATDKQTSAIASLVVKRKALLSNNKALETSVLGLEAKLAKATAALNAMKTASASAATSQGRLNANINSTQAQVNNLTNRVNASNSAMSRLGTGAMVGISGLQDLITAFGVASGAYLFAEIAKSIFQEVRALESLDLALRNITVTQSNFLTQQSFIAYTSEKYGLQIKDLTKQYTQWYVSAKEKLGETDIQEIFESIANAGANMGLSLESQNSVFLALEQMMSKGTVQAEELKRQLGNALPGAFEIMVKTIQKLNPEMRITQKSVLDLMRQGKIMSAEVLPEFAKQMEIAYGITAKTKVQTLNAEVNRLSNSWTNFVRDINGSNNTLGKIFAWLTNSATTAIDFWGDALESSATKRKKYLDSLMVGGSNLAKDNTNFIKDDGDKAEYAAKQIEILAEEYEELTKAKLGYEKINEKILKDSYSPYDGRQEVKTFKGVGKVGVNKTEDAKTYKKIQPTIAGIEDRMAVVQGLMDGYKALKLIEDDVHDDSIDGYGKRQRERIKLTFDWIKAQYALKKALIETEKLASSYWMNNEDKTLAFRLDARIDFAKQSVALLNLELEEEKALNVVKYNDDLERNRVAFKNKDINASEHAKNIADLNKRLNFEQLKSDEDYTQKYRNLMIENEAFGRKLYEKKLEYSRKLTKAEFDNFILQTDQEIARRNISDDDYMKAVNARRDAELDQAELARDEALRLAHDEAELKKAIWAEYGNAVFEINKKLDSSLETLSLRTIQREKDLREIRERAYGRQPIVGFKIQGILQGADGATIARFEELVENYSKAVKDGDVVMMEERKRQLDDFLAYVEKINEYAISFFEDFKSKSGFDTLFDVLGNKIEGFGENWKVTFLAISEIAQETFAFMTQNSQAYFDGERDRLANIYDYNLKLAGDNAGAKQALDEAYEQEKKQLAQREAKAKKESALFNIAIDTAQALVGLWVNPGFPAAIPLAVGVGALGIMQGAMVASKPLPSFFTGTENAPEGYANTDERGAELHLDRFGKIKDLGSDKGSRVKYLEKGDKIIPAHKTKNILNGNDLGSLDELLFKNNILYNHSVDNQLDASGIIDSISSLKHVIMNKETSEEIYDVRGHTKYIRKNGSRIEDKNNRIRFKKSII